MQVGVIGLGRHWQQRYKPALRALRDRLRVSLVCDPVHARARREARHLGCAAALGPTELLESDAVEAVLLADAQWFGLWPLQQACRLGKPALCGADLVADEPDLDRLRLEVEESRLPVQVALPPRYAPATTALLDLLAGRLGPARGLACDFFVSGPPPAAGRGPRLPVPLALLDWCAHVLDAEPVGVLAVGTDDGAFAGLVLEFPGGRRAQLTGWQAAAPWHPPRLRAIAERGWASAELPGRLLWADADGRHAFRAPGGPSPEAVLLDHFFNAVCSGRSPGPGLADAGRLVAWLRAAERSRAEGARVTIS